MRTLFRPGKNRTLLGLLLLAGVFCFPAGGPLLAEVSFYKIGKLKIELHKAEYEFERAGKGWIERTDPELRPLYVSKKVALNQKDMLALSIRRDKKSGSSEITFHFKTQAIGKVYKFTKKNVGSNLAIIINGELLAAPDIQMAFYNSIPIRTMEKPEETAFLIDRVSKFKKRSALKTLAREQALIRWLRKRNKRRPRDTDVRIFLILKYTEVRKCEGAARLISRRYIKNFHMSAFYAFGFCFSGQKRFNRAVKFYSRIYKRYPYPLVLLLRSRAYTKAHKYGPALRDLDNYLKHAPGRIDVSLERARVLVQLKSYEKAVKAYTYLLTKRPNISWLHLERGGVFERLKQVDAAVQDYRNALKYNPRSANALNALAWIYAVHNRKLKKALVYSRKSLKYEPGNPYFLDTLAEVYLKLGWFRQAKKVNQQALKRTVNPELIKDLKARMERIRLRRKGR